MTCIVIMVRAVLQRGFAKLGVRRQVPTQIIETCLPDVSAIPAIASAGSSERRRGAMPVMSAVRHGDSQEHTTDRDKLQKK